MAHFNATYGTPVVAYFKNGAMSLRPSVSSTPETTSIPAARNVSAPPAATGLGSLAAKTTRAMPAAIIARVQGGVFPVWLHGSSVQYSVDPRAFGPAPASALTSACAPPKR